MTAISPWFRIREYIRYRRQAKTRYGLHSPFVYALTDKCLYDKKKYPAYKSLKAYRKNLWRNPSYIHLRPAGAGSSYFTSYRRKVKDLLRVSSSGYKEMKLWYRLARYFEARNILELGTHIGVSTYAWSLGTKGKVTSVEGDAALAEFAREQLAKFDVRNADIVHASFDEFLDTASGTYDIIFLDGDHSYERTLHYLRRLKPLMHDDTLLIIHDIHWSPGMRKAWYEIIRDPDLHVTIDLFCCGLVFKRPGQHKQHFVVKF